MSASSPLVDGTVGASVGGAIGSFAGIVLRWAADMDIALLIHLVFGGMVAGTLAGAVLGVWLGGGPGRNGANASAEPPTVPSVR